MIERTQAGLLLVDVQEKLTPFIHESERLVKHCAWLIALAQALSIPVVISEQYPSGLKPTLAALRNLLPQDTPYLEKMSFSVCGEAPALHILKNTQIKQWVVCGIETHVCVLQSVYDLLQTGASVFVVADAVGSRNLLDHDYGLQRMRAWGAQVITREMFAFECLRTAGTTEFKDISRRFLK